MRIRRNILLVAMSGVTLAVLLQRVRLRNAVLPRISDHAWDVPGMGVVMSRSWNRKYAALEASAVPEQAIVMLGDSITEFADWPSLLPDAEIHNHGIGGDDTR